MVYFETKNIEIGCDGKDCKSNEVPKHNVKINSFYIDKNLVSVAQFSEFVKQQNYITEAEKFGNAGVFDIKFGEWKLVEKANWKFPQGINFPKAEQNHPVTQVSWNDACAYCLFLGKRMPTENEWEFAARNGKTNASRFSWGSQLVENQKYKSNVWQGKFPENNTQNDGFLFTSPIGFFGKTESGMTDMGGNVWQWCQDTYKLYPGNNEKFVIDTLYKAIRGGSFLCDSNECFSYRNTARNSCSKETSLMHIGFRCAKSN